MKKPETKIEQKFVDHVATLKNVMALKLVLFGLAGFPDRAIFVNGRVFFIEFKDGDNVLSEQQIYWKTILIKLGFNFYTCYSAERAIRILKKQMKK